MSKVSGMVVQRHVRPIKVGSISLRLSGSGQENLEKLRGLLTSEHLGPPNTTQVVEAALKIATETLMRRAA